MSDRGVSRRRRRLPLCGSDTRRAEREARHQGDVNDEMGNRLHSTPPSKPTRSPPAVDVQPSDEGTRPSGNESHLNPWCDAFRDGGSPKDAAFPSLACATANAVQPGAWRPNVAVRRPNGRIGQAHRPALRAGPARRSDAAGDAVAESLGP